MAESFSEAGKAAAKGAVDVGVTYIDVPQGGKILIHISTDNIQVAKELCKLAGYVSLGVGVVSLGTLLGYRLLRPLIEDAVNAVLGRNRDDQEIREIGPGSLHVLLHCFTDERYLEVLEDYESGKIKERLEKEFGQIFFNVQGLNVKIINMEEVNKTKKAISKRSSYTTEVMTEIEARTDLLVTDEGKLSARKNQGYKIDISKEHGNWLNVGELIRSIQKPISIYVDEIVQALHVKLCKDLLSVGKCSTPEDCNKKTKPTDLCKSCKGWFKVLKDSHEKSNSSWWHKNCISSEWSEDHWEVAKFFMPPLGTNLNTVKDAEYTDLSSLLNVLEWMNDGTFLGKTRVNVDLVRELRSQVRNTWAHAPLQELADDKMAEGFSIATDFLEDLEKVWSHAENGKCLERLKNLRSGGVTNVVESELQSLLLQRHVLDGIKEEITKMKVERSSDKTTIKEHEKMLKNLECALNEWSQRMFDFESFKENMNKQFHNFAEDLKSFRSIPEDIHEIRDSIVQIRNDFAKINKRQKEEQKLTSCLPDRLPNFIGREAEIQGVITFLMNEEKAVVSLHGGPGFGKTAIAIEMSHKLSESHNNPVVFSQLTTASSVDEMIRQLCLDVGVNHEDDPKSSLIVWLKNIKTKVIFVMDDIDNLLEDYTFYKFVPLLRKYSNQHCQIVTTSRTSYEISELETAEVEVEEMGDETCMELMRKQCPGQDDEYLRKVAELCGKIPLAMCIAGSQVDRFAESDELLQHLQERPMKTLERPKNDEYVYRAINMSYEKCSNEEKETLVRLAVFDGIFSEEAAKAVFEKDNLLDTKRTLETFVRRSLIKQPTKLRYSIHLLIKHFLMEQQKGENEIAQRAKAQAMRAEVLMVEYYLKLGHDLTMKSYSKDGYKANREALKQEAHNIQNVLKVCCQQHDPTTSDISDCLAHTNVYTTSARFFSLFVRTIIPGSIVNEFLQRCANLAKERKQHAIKINFDCLLADQERIKSIGTSDEKLTAKMEEIKREFKTQSENLKEDKSLCAHFYYQLGRYLTRKSESHMGKERFDLQFQARTQLEKSLKLRETLTDSSVGKADKVFSLLHLGNVCKLIHATEWHLGKKDESKESLEEAKECYAEAIRLSQNDLGDHELTSSCHKSLGDLFLKNHKLNEAKEEYTIAKEMRENLKLDANERHVFLLKNLGQCLRMNKRTTEAIEILESARDMAEKLAENDEPNKCKAMVYTTLAIAHHSKQSYSRDAVKYAKKAMEFERLRDVVKTKDYKELEDILQES